MPFLHKRKAAICTPNDASQRTGYRPYVQLTQSRYVGKWAVNKKHGFGTDTFGNGDKSRVYEGNFRNNQRHGFGTLRKPMPNGNFSTLYVGGWLAGRRHGDGKRFYANGNVYWGEWADGVRCGRGFLWLDDGSTYVGEWKDDKYEGAGVLFQGLGSHFQTELIILNGTSALWMYQIERSRNILTNIYTILLYTVLRIHL